MLLCVPYVQAHTYAGLSFSLSEVPHSLSFDHVPEFELACSRPETVIH